MRSTAVCTVVLLRKFQPFQKLLLRDNKYEGSKRNYCEARIRLEGLFSSLRSGDTYPPHLIPFPHKEVGPTGRSTCLGGLPDEVVTLLATVIQMAEVKGKLIYME